MPFVIVGVLLMIAKWAEFGPFAEWSWWIILSPFLLAALWWEFADGTGWTKRRAMDKMEQKKIDRREKAMEALGMSRRHAKVVTRAQRAKAVQVSADPTFAGRDAPSKPIDAPEPRRDPKL